MLKNIYQYYVYIITNKKNGTIYIGMTNDLERIIFEHKNELIDGFSKRYSLDKLVYFEICGQVKDVILREKRIKKWKRQWKINLIVNKNPDWNDLAINWFN